jgi:hypothetical protein
MAESIRSLTVKLGYDIDTTGADIFKARFKRVADDTKRIADRLDKAFQPKPAKRAIKGPLEKRLDRLNKKINTFKQNLKKAFKIDKGIENDLKLVANKVKAGFDKIKVVALAGAAAVAAAGAKVFTGFADIEQARVALEFRAGDDFEQLSNRINKVREETGGVVSELDALNAFNLGADVIGDFDFLADNFGTVIKLAKVLGKDVGEVQQAFATFIASGSNLQELVKFGFFTPEQIDALKKASTDFSQQGLETRKTLLGAKISEGAPRLQESFNDFLTKSNATLDRLTTNLEDTTVIVGKKLNPVINDFVGRLDQITTKIKTAVTGLEPGQRFTVPTGASRAGVGAPTLQDNSTTTNNITVNGAGDPELVAAEVEKKMSRKIIQNSIRKEIPQSLNTTVQPAVNQ